MNLFFRMIRIIITAFAGRPATMEAVHAVHFRVWPNDLDTNLHMNNGRYLTLMDLGRVDMMIRAGLARTIMREKWMPVIAGISMIYRRSLSPFERYRLETRMLGWDDRWVYLEQTFIRANGDLAARGFVKAAFLKGGIRISNAEIARISGHAGPAPHLPDALKGLFPSTETLSSPPLASETLASETPASAD